MSSKISLGPPPVIVAFSDRQAVPIEVVVRKGRIVRVEQKHELAPIRNSRLRASAQSPGVELQQRPPCSVPPA